MSLRCFACRTLIREPKLVTCDNKYFHERCLKCEVCARPSSDALYAFNGSLLCREDYNACHASCRVCRAPLLENEHVFRVTTGAVHLKCMVCVKCARELTTGDRVILGESGLACEKCTSGQQKRGRKRTVIGQ